MQTASKVEQVIEILGGDREIVALCGVAAPNAAYMWRSRGNFPPETYVLLIEALKAKGYTAPPSLWRMREGAAA